MSVESIHNLEKEIHRDQSPTEFANNGYANRIKSLGSSYSTSTHLVSYQKIIQELNKKYTLLNLSNKIVAPVDGGLTPTTLTNFMS